MKNRQLSMNIDLNDIDDSKVKKGFDIVNSKKEAIKLLNDYYDINVEPIDLDFNKDIWLLRNKLNYRKVIFDFTIIISLLKKDKILYLNEILVAIKCWIAEMLSVKSIETVRQKFYDLQSALFATRIFDINRLDKLIELLESSTVYRKNSKKEFEITSINRYSILTYCRNIKDFLLFYNADEFADYIDEISQFMTSIKVQFNNRELPTIYDVMKFKQYIEAWYHDISRITSRSSEAEFIRFFPVLFWWKLTSIIPVRPTEFCLIKRNCLDGKDNKISFPRLKFHRKGEMRIENQYDTLPIPTDLQILIQKYIDLTDKYGESRYLIHFTAFLEVNKGCFSQEANNGVTVTRQVGKFIFKTNLGNFIYGNEKYFVKDHLDETIAKFYRDVIYKKYNVNILGIAGLYYKILQTKSLFSVKYRDSINSMLRPGDLRHIAIINMMLQGYNPVEIKRLAGHIDIKTQMSYLNHMGFWVDSEIHQLAAQFSTINYSVNINTDETISFNSLMSPLSIKMYQKLELHTNFLHLDEFEILEEQKLEIGFCKDKHMPCSCFNWKHKGCYYCKHWAITIKELDEKREYILKDINLIYDELGSKINFLKSLYKLHWNENNPTDNEVNKDMKLASNDVQNGIFNMAKLIGMLGGEVYE